MTGILLPIGPRDDQATNRWLEFGTVEGSQRADGILIGTATRRPDRR